jgi:hypothetical protein
MLDMWRNQGIAHTVSWRLKQMRIEANEAIAVLQVASSLITDDLARLVDHVKDLVGETDFSFTVSMSDSTLDSTESGASSRKGKKD